MRLASTFILVLVSSATLSAPLAAQRIPGYKPVYTAILVAPNIQLAPRCETKTVWNNIKKIWVTNQTGKVVFKMTVTGPPSGLMVSDSSGMVELPVVNGQDTPPIDPAGEILDFHAPGFGALPMGTVLVNQFAPMGASGSLYHVWPWPAGMSLWGANRWAANKCNNIPVKPITALEASPWIKEINKGLLLGNPVVGPGGPGGGPRGGGVEIKNDQVKN